MIKHRDVHLSGVQSCVDSDCMTDIPKFLSCTACNCGLEGVRVVDAAARQHRVQLSFPATQALGRCWKATSALQTQLGPFVTLSSMYPPCTTVMLSFPNTAHLSCTCMCLPGPLPAHRNSHRMEVMYVRKTHPLGPIFAAIAARCASLTAEQRAAEPGEPLDTGNASLQAT